MAVRKTLDKDYGDEALEINDSKTGTSDSLAIATVLVEVSSVQQRVIAKEARVNSTIVRKSNGMQAEGGNQVRHQL